MQAILCRLTPRAYSARAVRTGAPRRAGDTLIFPCRIEESGRRVAAFDLHYTITGASLVLTLENVVEQAGFELIEVALPDLVSVGQDQPDAWFAEGREGGSFVRLAAAKPVKLADDPYFGRISTQMPVGMIGTARIGCVMEVSAYMDGTETEIAGTPGALRALLGTIQTHRVHGGRCYNMNDAGPMLCGIADTPNLIVGQRSAGEHVAVRRNGDPAQRDRLSALGDLGQFGRGRVRAGAGPYGQLPPGELVPRQ